jgi:hypothetical protein
MRGKGFEWACLSVITQGSKILRGQRDSTDCRQPDPHLRRADTLLPGCCGAAQGPCNPGNAPEQGTRGHKKSPYPVRIRGFSGSCWCPGAESNHRHEDFQTLEHPAQSVLNRPKEKEIAGIAKAFERPNQDQSWTRCHPPDRSRTGKTVVSMTTVCRVFHLDSFSSGR